MGERSADIIAIAAKAEAHFSAGKPLGRKLNVYRCEGSKSSGTMIDANFVPPTRPCGTDMVTIDREWGVTPFMIRCRSCGGVSYSQMYRVDPRVVPTWEWYRPDTLDGLLLGELDHVERGGLLLREIREAEPEKPTLAEDARAKANMLAAATLTAQLIDGRPEADVWTIVTMVLGQVLAGFESPDQRADIAGKIAGHAISIAALWDALKSESDHG